MYGTLSVRIKSAQNLPDRDGGFAGGSDAYVAIYAGEKELDRTEVIEQGSDPVWNAAFSFSVGDEYSGFKFVVNDQDTFDAEDLLGWVEFPVAEVASGNKIHGWFPLQGPGQEAGAQLQLSLKYTSFKEHAKTMCVPSALFPLRTGCRVTQYQDAHCQDCGMPEVEIQPRRNGQQLPINRGLKKGWRRRRRRNKKHRWETFDDEANEGVDDALNAAMAEDGAGGVIRPAPYMHQPRDAFEEIYTAIAEAKKFIYITGWSVWCHMSLVRNEPVFIEGFDEENGRLTTGELLKKKAEEGVTVLVMIWDEVTSGLWGFDGLMGTKDEETKEFFADSGVTVVGAPREGHLPAHSVMFTHHQKTVIVDADRLVDEDEEEDERRRIIAFVGGLDLTYGRWDTPTHNIYSSLDEQHAEDFHNAVAPTEGGGVTQPHGPREPWHDIHCKVEGAIARDVMDNFVQRWTKQAPDHVDLLIDRNDPDTFITEEEEEVTGQSHPNTWCCQLFRSIDGHAADGLPIDPPDRSIQDAYLHHIARAKKYLYFENQYFLGSSQEWIDQEDVGCNNEIPIAIVQKIEERIRKGKRFAAYIVIPMYPEGPPDSGSVQEILRWQYNTVCMMYKRVADAIAEAGIDAHPTDYLNFYCLGNRTTEETAGRPPSEEPAAEGSYQEIVNGTRRVMIYVHSKMLIMDDEYIIIGSANINDRSMAGNRDSEIAVGSFQPQHTVKACAGCLPRGKVHAFRKSLWAEHCNQVLPEFDTPQTVECVHAVNQMAEANWEAYVGDEVVDLPGHLLSYPYTIDTFGTVTPKVVSFPDMPESAKVEGMESGPLINVLTV
eukprot:TRINITY_DN55673_c0_g1_i1.p1 TRINITY_DN55673_c0_g1~~TRINITY_DN55673_c0_g1_i1.p1  ORF type:complete len:877 (+),score=117.73 TRINITY_DN55673_c0_g1_i1:151-2631(+)